jgi:hypothetical protein
LLKSSLVYRLWPFLLLACSIHVCAHQGSTSYLSLVVEPDRLLGRWEIPVQNLDLALKLDANGDRRITLEELRGRFSEIKSHTLQHLKLNADGVNGLVVVTNDQPNIAEFHDGDSTALDFVVTNFSSRPTNLVVDYGFMFDLKPDDRAFMQIECRGTTQTGFFTADQRIQEFNLETRGLESDFRAFAGRGTRHVWTGFDHFLLVAAWLLPAVLCLDRNQPREVRGFGQAFANVFKVVTAFTVAHSLTMSLATVRVLDLASQWVSPALAVSVVLAAGNNIYPVLRDRVWLLAFVFGLIHGCGFTGEFLHPEPQGSGVLALLGFNLGVEAGQLVIAMAFLPIAYALRGADYYANLILKGGSGLIVVLGCLWLMDMLLGLELLADLTPGHLMDSVHGLPPFSGIGNPG